MVVDFSKINLKERPMLVLKTQSDEVIQTLGYAFNVEADLMYNEVSTLTFDLPAYVNGVKTPNYDEVKGTRIVDFVGVGLFILVDPTTENDGVSEIKHCKAYSLEYEFTKKQFYIAGNEDDPDEDGNVGYKMVYKFYDSFDGVSNTETIIGRIHEKMPEWTFEIVDADLYDKYRTFDSDVSDNVYNFIKSTVQETYGCIFDFDTYNRHVKVVSTESAIAQRQVFLSKENLIKKIDINEDSDSVVTSLDVSGEEGVSIRFVNPTGQNNIYDLHYFLDELPASLRTKWNEWTAACEAQRQNYFNLAMSYQVKIADILAEQVKLVDLQGELKTAETIQGAEVSKPDSKQSDLSNAKAEVTRATNAVNAQQSVVNTKTAAKDSVLDSIKAINYSLAWEPVRDSNGNIIGGPWKDSKGQAFTAAELKTLRRYFFEDSVEDSSFALATTNSYTNKDVGSSLSNITINISNSKIERASSSSPMYSFTGGKIKVGTSPSYVSAKIVRGTAEVDPSTKKVILTAYLERGDYSQTDFEDEGTGRSIFDCGTITLTGTYTTMTYNGSTTSEGIYSGTSLALNKSTVNVYFTKNTSEFEQYSVEWDLFNYGKEILEERSEPSYTFTVESGNFLVIDDFFQFQNDLKLGQRVYLNLDDTKKVPFVTSVHLNYEDLSDFKIEFCNTYRASDSSFRLSQLLEQSIRLGKSLNIKGGMYSQFQATGAQNAVKEFMNSALDIAKNNVLSSENQAITFDESGLRLRKWKDKDAGTYEDEQIWMNDNTIAFTDDNWSTAKMAIGKIIDTSLFGYVKTGDKKRDTTKTYYTKQSDGTYREWTGSTTWNTNLYEKGYAYGIAAPYLVGTVLAGSNLIITADGHTFRIDGNGIRIKTNSLLITSKDDTDPKTFEQTQEDTKDAAVKDAKEYTNSEFDEFMTVYDHGDDGLIVTYYGESEPEDAEVGDLWYYENIISVPNAKTGKSEDKKVGTLKRCIKSYILKAKTDTEANRVYDYTTISSESYEWKKNRDRLDKNTVYLVIDHNADTKKIYQGSTLKSDWEKKTGDDCWELVQDEDAIKAVASANDARFIADNKINTFYSTTMPIGVTDKDGNILIPLDTGDLWYKLPPKDYVETEGATPDPADGCMYGRMYWYDGKTESWKMVQDYSIKRIDSTLSDYWDVTSGLMDRMDDKMNTFYMDTMPTINGDHLENNDLFFYTGNDNLKTSYPITINGEAANPNVFKPSHLYQVKITTTGTTSTIVGWTEIIDQQIVDAVTAAQNAQDTADKKASTYARPTIPGTQDGDEEIDVLDNGDLWFNTHKSDEGGFWYPSQSSTDKNKVFYRDGKLYRYEHRAGKPSWSNWVLMEDADINAKAIAMGVKMLELMKVLDANDNDMNVFELKESDNFNTLTSGAQTGDLLFYVGANKRTVTVNGKSEELMPNALYRLTVTSGKITAMTEEDDDDAKEAIRAAHKFQNYTDGKSKIYAQPDPPDTSKMSADDKGDMWLCTAESGTTVDGIYTGGKMYYYEHGGTPPWIEIKDPDISKQVLDYGNTVRDLMLAMDEKINVWELLSDTAVPTVKKGLSNGDLIYVHNDAGNKTITVNGKPVTLSPDGLYRIYVTNSSVSGYEEIKDEDGNIKKAILSANSIKQWKNLEDGKVTVHVQDHLPGTGSDDELTKEDEGDIWFCTKDIDSNGDGKADYFKDKVYRMVWKNTAGATWEVIQDPAIASQIGDVYDVIAGLREDLDDKVTTYYSDRVPSDAENGDLLYFTGDSTVVINTDKITEDTGSKNVIVSSNDKSPFDIISNGSNLTLHNGTTTNVSIHSSSGWARHTYTVSKNFGIVEYVDKTNKFYPYITIRAGGNGGLRPIVPGDDLSGMTINFGRTIFKEGHLYILRVMDERKLWMELTDQDAITAIANAKEAQDVADGKAETFWDAAPPTPTEHGKGDLWYCTMASGSETSDLVVGGTYESGRLYYCDEVGSGSSKQLKWRLLEDKMLSREIAKINTKYGKAMIDIMLSFDARDTEINIFQKNTIPTIADDDVQNNDLFLYTGNTQKTIYIDGNQFVFKYNHLYRATVSNNKITAWTELTDDAELIKAITAARASQDILDGKAVVYYQNTIPSIESHSKGDLWYNTATTGPTGYEPQRMYYCTGTSWVLIEDKGMVQQIEDAKTEVQSEIARFYQSTTPGSEEKFLAADIIKGTIDASVTSISSAKATGGTNFYQDEYGYWFADKIIEGDYPRREAETAIWINDKGILYGHKVGTGTVLEPVVNFKAFSGDNYDYESGRNGDTYWVWTTSINHQGITTQALAAQTLTGVHITGGSTLQIGAKTFGNDIKYAFKVDENGQIFAGLKSDGSDYNFKVDKDGNVTVNGSGTFSGTIHANDGDFKGTVYANDLRIKNGSNYTDESIVQGGKISGEYLDLKGINIKDSNNNTVMSINESGVTLKSGAISWNSNVPKSRVTGLSTIEETANNAASDAGTAISTANNAASDASTALSHASTAEQIAKNIANGSYSGTFIDGTKIYSPEIYSTTFSVLPNSDTQPTSGGFEIWGYVMGVLRKMLQISYVSDSIPPSISFSSGTDSATAHFQFDKTYFWNAVDFSHATVTGLSSTATFG